MVGRVNCHKEAQPATTAENQIFIIYYYHHTSVRWLEGKIEAKLPQGEKNPGLERMSLPKETDQNFGGRIAIREIIRKVATKMN